MQEKLFSPEKRFLLFICARICPKPYRGKRSVPGPNSNNLIFPKMLGALDLPMHYIHIMKMAMAVPSLALRLLILFSFLLRDTAVKSKCKG